MILPVTAPETLDAVLQELGTFITEEIAATQISIGCLRTVAHHVLTDFESAEDQQATRLLGTEVPCGGWIASVPGISGARALVAEMADGGPTHCRMTQQWIVRVYTGWDAEFRKRVAAAHGVDVNGVQADFFGDLRRLRNDIVHHRGVVTKNNGARCKTISNRRLTPGDPVYLRDDEFQQMHLRVPWAALVRLPGL